MNIFNNLKPYTPKNEERQKPKLEEPKTNFQNIKEILLDGLPAIGFYFGLLTVSGLIWYFGSISFLTYGSKRVLKRLKNHKTLRYRSKRVPIVWLFN